VAERLRVNPDGLRSTAEHLEAVSSRMKDIISALNREAGALGAPWGDDEGGKEFAEGAEGYLAQKDWVEGSVDAKAKLLDDYAWALRTAADTLEQQDSGAPGHQT
jgi:uncharacterized protein YukE